MVVFYVLTEDSDPGARSHSHDTWAALLRRMCRLIDPACQTQAGQIDVIQPELAVRAMMAGNGWRETTRHPRQVQFWRTLADELLAGRVLVFHVDGDTGWSGRVSSTNVEQTEQIAVRRLRMALEDLPAPIDAERISELMTRFVRMHPFRAVEAWLLQNTPVLRRLCKDLGRPELLGDIDEWEADATLLDEIDGTQQPKRQMPFGSRHNRELAEQGFPAQRVFEAGKSFHASVLALGQCLAVREGLRQTYAPEQFQR